MNDGDSPHSLAFVERPARTEPQGLLFLHHGRGTYEGDLIGLADVFDPGRRLHVVAPRAPLQLPGQPGYHWYRVPRVGHPDPESFFMSCDRLGRFHDQIWDETGIGPERTVLGGFSMGAVMSYTMAFSDGRPQVAGVLALSGFIPTLDQWQPQFQGRESTHVLIAHGRNDPVISVEFARVAKDQLLASGVDAEYRQSEASHNIDPTDIAPINDWLLDALP
jgi:phospholipase/carboxylesterase